LRDDNLYHYGERGESEMDKEIIFIVEESPEGGYEAKALGYSIYTEGESLEELKNAIRDAVRCHFEEEEMPHIIRLHMVKEELIPV
jgi:hypothetical protein